MATCKDCLHVDLCRYNAYQEARRLGKDKKELITIDNKVACKFFKDKSQFIELPMKTTEWLHTELTEHCFNRCMEEL